MRVWWDYDSSDPDHPPNWREFQVWPGDLLFIDDPEEPTTDDTVRVWYTLAHTLNGLDSATATTFRADHESVIAVGAAAFAALFRSQVITETVTADGWAPRNLRTWGETMMERFGCDPADVWAGIGPTIGPCCYEVGPEVVEAVQAACPPWADVARSTNGRVHLDLPGAVHAQLQAAGVERIEDCGLCTACRVDEFFSHRAEGGRTGRFGVAMGLVE